MLKLTVLVITIGQVVGFALKDTVLVHWYR